jgi:hypothetical protein
MKRFALFLSLALSFVTLACSRNAHPKVVLQNEFWHMPSREFYVRAAIDARAGGRIFGQADSLGITTPDGLDNFELIMTRFFQEAMPKLVDQKPIFIRIKNLQIQEKRSLLKTSGNVNLYIEFLAIDTKGIPTKLFGVQSQQKYEGKTQSQALKKVLRSTTTQFSASGWEKKYPQNL